jgi:hypothetical protein
LTHFAHLAVRPLKIHNGRAGPDLYGLTEKADALRFHLSVVAVDVRHAEADMDVADVTLTPLQGKALRLSVLEEFQDGFSKLQVDNFRLAACQAVDSAKERVGKVHLKRDLHSNEITVEGDGSLHVGHTQGCMLNALKHVLSLVKG